jgi:hypothetical protein
MEHLSSLKLDGTPITNEGVAILMHIPSLKHLSLPSSKIDNGVAVYLSQMQGLQSLRSYDITDAGLIHIGKLTNLRHLRLGMGISDEGVIHLSKLRNLEFLSLPGAKITKTGLVHLANLPLLQRLDLVGCPLTDDDVPYLCAMTSLQRLNIGETLINPSGYKTLKDALPDCFISYSKLVIQWD